MNDLSLSNKHFRSRTSLNQKLEELPRRRRDSKPKISRIKLSDLQIATYALSYNLVGTPILDFQTKKISTNYRRKNDNFTDHIRATRISRYACANRRFSHGAAIRAASNAAVLTKSHRTHIDRSHKKPKLKPNWTRLWPLKGRLLVKLIFLSLYQKAMVQQTGRQSASIRVIKIRFIIFMNSLHNSGADLNIGHRSMVTKPLGSSRKVPKENGRPRYWLIQTGHLSGRRFSMGLFAFGSEGREETSLHFNFDSQTLFLETAE